MTQLIDARKGMVTPAMEAVALAEKMNPGVLRQSIAEGLVVIPMNNKHMGCRAVGIGRGCRTKVNANIGSSQEHCNINEELEKLSVSIEAGADTVMDLSTGGDLDSIRRLLIENCPVPLGTVPIYQCVVELVHDGLAIRDLSENRIIETVRRHGESGVDFITIHSGLTKRAVDKMPQSGRIMNVVSRGGAFITNWIRTHGRENPFYTCYDRLIEIALEYDMTFSLGDGLRPGCLHDATDGLQMDELLVLGELRERAVSAGVQVMIEGPGHVPLKDVKSNMELQKAICHGAPFYVLGPIVTDVAPGYDHITGAIGGAIAAANGADFLCFLTPSEHLRLPTVEDTREGVIATKIAAHAGDIAKGISGARDWDDEMSRARHARDWNKMFQLALDGKRAREYRESSPTKSPDVCTMCGDLCSMKSAEDKDKNAVSDPTL
ncbi:MAG TPA: phosphomethylpyrimidine synthase ThiC [Candidatus Sumerlaeota bacterium]|mgnify:CR=1 FL=1|nr:phosphomethylpyrimidine synthase ThiC [Candidatus Sumerlaeota bacterium]